MCCMRERAARLEHVEHTHVLPPPARLPACCTQPAAPPNVAACPAYCCSPQHLVLQPAPPSVAARSTYCCRRDGAARRAARGAVADRGHAGDALRRLAGVSRRAERRHVTPCARRPERRRRPHGAAGARTYLLTMALHVLLLTYDLRPTYFAGGTSYGHGWRRHACRAAGGWQQPPSPTVAGDDALRRSGAAQRAQRLRAHAATRRRLARSNARGALPARTRREPNAALRWLFGEVSAVRQ